MKRSWILLGILIVIVIPGFSYGGYSWYKNGAGFDLGIFKGIFSFLPDKAKEVSYKTPEEKDKYVRFDMEAYDKIVENYWEKTEDDKLSELFRLSFAKAASTSPDSVILPSKDRAGVAKMISAGMSDLSDGAKKKLALDIVVVALYNLQPAGRSGILSSQEETALRNNEKNINPNSNLYQDLGVQNGASPEEVNTAYTQKKAELTALSTPEAKAELEKISYAHQVLTDESTKARYDESKVEPTVFSRIIGGKTLYFYWEQVSPTTLQEFGMDIINASTTPGLDSMIIDLRGNIGGTLDFAKYFMGFFLGQNQYAFDLFHKGDYKVERTVLSKLPELERYKEIAILSDSMTQSTAELIAATFKRFHLGRVIGTATRGWGTVENTFPMETVIEPGQKYSLFLVHSITISDDNQPIEGRGVFPDVDIKKSGWQNKLGTYFRLPSIISALSEVADKPPRK